LFYFKRTKTAFSYIYECTKTPIDTGVYATGNTKNFSQNQKQTRVAKIANILATLLLSVSTVFFNDCDRYFTFYWPSAEFLAGAHEPLGFAETRLKTTDIQSGPKWHIFRTP